MLKQPVVNNYRSDRNRVSRPRKDKRVFSRTADRGHYLNSLGNPMRGGIRL